MRNHIVSTVRRLFTSESVTEGHPDKLCDAISDTLLDAYLAQDPHSHVAIESFATTGQVHIGGEVRSDAHVDIYATVRNAILDVGYDDTAKGLDGNNCAINISIGQQSLEIAGGVDVSHEVRTECDEDELSRQGAGDQGLMFGYACIDTPELMPLPIALAHRLSRRLAEERKNNELPWLRPDGKTQVTIEYDGHKAVRLDTVIISTQHDAGIDLDSELTPAIHDRILNPVLESLSGTDLDIESPRLLVNPSGSFILGGPMCDAGLTGRKIIVDTYGGMARHGGGAFSGKDPSKVDRSAAYAMRWVAKNVVAAGLADRVEVQVAYAIGKAAPVGLFVETFGTEKCDPLHIQEAIEEVFDLRPGAIVRDLDLLRPIYRQTAAYGHFGRTDIDLPWENTDRAADLASLAGLTA
ncbi:methionine adenosyltransferase [Lawsonella clevelandensis]|uniref:methionine adenosyltransferase n=1 Tax=Lawsonella clevelandensis TaxID=1528099 RepID=UPI0026EB3E01|nr:methionine adenosyltransferase [Lawsonella clevelandensis]